MSDRAGSIPTDTSFCPHCGSSQIVPIVYGLPSYEDFLAARRGKFVLGGCVVDDGMPTRLCKACGERLGPGLKLRP